MCRAGMEVIGTPSRTTEANVDCAFVESALVITIYPKIGGGGLNPPGPDQNNVMFNYDFLFLQ